MSETAFVIGHSGAIGSALCKKLAEKKRFSKVVLYGRRVIDTAQYGPEFESKTIDFDNLKAEDFHGFDQAFSAIGVTGMQSNEVRKKIDRDGVLAIAEAAKQGGCKHFHLVSTMGAAANSSLYGLRLKFQAEEGVEKLNFDKASIYRAPMLFFPRKDNTWGRQFWQDLSRPIEWMCPAKVTIHSDVMMTAIYNRTKTEEMGTHTFIARDMLRLSKETEN